MSPGYTALAMEMLAGAKPRLEALATDLARAPAQYHDLYAAATASLASGDGVRGFTYVMILLLVGCGVEWLYWSYAYASWRAIQTATVAGPREALWLGLRRLALQTWGLLLFAIATIGASAAFRWPSGVQEAVISATLLVFALRFAWVVVSAILAPGRPRWRLVAVPSARAGWLAAAAMLVVALLALGQVVPDLLERVAGARHVAGALRLVLFGAAALLLGAGAVALAGRPAGRSKTPAGKRGLPRFPKGFVAVLLVVAVYGVWLVAPGSALPAAIMAVVVALLMAVRPLVFFFWQDETGAAPQAGARAAGPGVLPSIVLSAARFLIVLLGIGAAALALDTPLAVLVHSESPLQRFGLRVLGVATLALLTNVVWIVIRTSIDQRLARIRPRGAFEPPDASSRLLTLLPLLRVTAAVLLIAMLILSSLWALGIEITPLLAGAGVVGLALGFGAQALVRDIIAGIFLLAEDAFRIGEYIESGSAIKGTVERITLRSVALRHHNGPLYFVPYGALGTLRNTSRDWVIEKFNIPLPISADSEKIRKMIKKIGEEMMSDPVVGPLIIEPLKGKLDHVEPGIKIFRCKFRTAPGNQFDVRAQALKRIENALIAMGVPFASGAQTVILPQPPAPAAAGAATG